MTRNHRSSSVVELAQLARDPSQRDAVTQELSFRGRTPKAHALAAMLGCTILDRASGLQRVPYKHLTGDEKKAAEGSFVAPVDPQAPVTRDPRESLRKQLQAQLAALEGTPPAAQVGRDPLAVAAKVGAAIQERQRPGNLPPLPDRVVVGARVFVPGSDSGTVDGVDYSQERTPDGLKTHDKHGRRRSAKAIANTRKMLAAKAAKQAQRDSALSGAAFPQDDDHTAPTDPGVDYSATQEIRASDIPLNSDAALVAWITENE